MMRGDELEGWRDKNVAEALDLCLACKACKNECPVNVDMATYKAEFLSHHYKGRLRPRADYAITLIYWWARLASRLPRLVNLVTHAPVISRLVKKIGGVAQERTVPPFATETFTHWFEHRPGTRAVPALDRPRHEDDDVVTYADVDRVDAASYPGRSKQPGLRENTMHPHGQKAPFETDRVLLWPDTFNNYLESSVLQAAVEVIEDAGYLVEIPPRPLCCGRPLYDAGMLSTAERLWKQVLETLRPWTRDGVPVQSSRGWASTTSCSTRAAAAWPVRSGSTPTSTRCRCAWGSACCSLVCGSWMPTPRSSPTASAAATRSSRARPVPLFISPG